MAVAYVQTHNVGDGSNGSATATLATTVDAGRVLFASVSVRADTPISPAPPSTITISGQPFTRLGLQYCGNSSGAHIALYYRVVSGTLSQGADLAVTAGSGAITVELWEYRSTTSDPMVVTLYDAGTETLGITIPSDSANNVWGIFAGVSQDKNGGDLLSALTPYDTTSSGSGGPTNYITTNIAGSTSVTSTAFAHSDGAWLTATLEEQGGAFDGTASLAGAGTTSATGAVAVLGSAALAGSGTTSATGTVGTASDATLSGSGDTTATGQVSVTVTGEASLTGTGSTTATGEVTLPGDAALAGEGTTSATGLVGVSSDAALAGSGETSAAGSVETYGAAALAGAGETTATGSVVSNVDGDVSLEGTGSTSATGTVGVFGAVALSGTGVTTAAGGPPYETGYAAGVVNSWLDTYCDDPYVQLHTGDPGADGTANVSQGYPSRVQATTGAASAGSKSATSVGPFTNGGVQEDITDVSLWTAPSGGTFIRSLQLPEPISWRANGVLVLPTLEYGLEVLV